MCNLSSCSINNILVFLLFIIFIYLLFRTYKFNELKEMFTGENDCYDKPDDSKCFYSPMGESKDACILKCLADKDVWGGDNCTEKDCEKICSGINNPVIEPDREGILDNLLMVVPYNHGANVYINMDKLEGENFLEYHQSNNKIDGVFYKKVTEPLMKLNNLRNNIEYSLKLVKENNETKELEPSSNTVYTTCSKNSELLL